MPDWQPIETAPKDRFIMLYEDGAMRLAFWASKGWTQPAIPILVTEAGNRFTSYDIRSRRPKETLILSDCLHEPTHWMPLPKPPTE